MLRYGSRIIAKSFSFQSGLAFQNTPHATAPRLGVFITGQALPLKQLDNRIPAFAARLGGGTVYLSSHEFNAVGVSQRAWYKWRDTRKSKPGLGLFTPQVGYAWNATLLYVKEAPQQC